VRVTKDSSRTFIRSFPGFLSASSRGEDSGTEAVHALIADRDTAGHGYFMSARKQRGENSRTMGEERRKNDRRQRQIEVVLNTRLEASRRQNQAIDEKA
jgi:hypothetical protein